MKFILFSLSLLLASAANAGTVESRATYFNQFFGVSSPGYLDVKVKTAISGTRNVMTVIPGVLYRGGGAGGQHPLSDQALMALCQDGFSLAVYAYTVNYRDPGVIRCMDKEGQPNSLRYIAGQANTPDFKDKFLREVQTVINDPTKGPIFDHCWNGDHASGELAAVALRQFCGWNGDQASKYWLRHAAGAPLISRIGKFSPIGGLSIPGNEQDSLCAQKP